MKALLIVMLLAIACNAQPVNSRRDAKPPRKMSKEQQAAASVSPTPTATPSPEPTPQAGTWTEWAVVKGVVWGIGKVLSLAVFVLIWPVYKAGFYVRQGLAYHSQLDELDAKLSQGARLTPEGKDAYESTMRKKRMMLVAAPLFIALIAVVLVALTTWKLSLISVGVAFCGFVNVRD